MHHFIGTCNKDVILYENILITYCLKTSVCYVSTAVQLLLYSNCCDAIATAAFIHSL